jgi:hypothetical protein
MYTYLISITRYCSGFSGFRLRNRIKSLLNGRGLILAPYNSLASFMSRYTLFVIDDPTQFPKFGRHVFIPVAAEFLPRHLLDLGDDDLVVHLVATNSNAMCAWLYAFSAARAFVVKAAGRQSSPFQQASNWHGPKRIDLHEPLSLRS